MIKASALNVVVTNSPVKNYVPDTIDSVSDIELVSTGMEAAKARSNQNIRIEYVKGETDVPEMLEDIAYAMYVKDTYIKDALYKIRKCYSSKEDKFYIDLKNMSNAQRNEVKSFFMQEMRILFSEVTHIKESDTLCCTLSFAPAVKKFLTGEYLEIAVSKRVKAITNKLASQYSKHYVIHNNVKVTTNDGKVKNEFDIVIENVTDKIVYVLEVKSGDSFSDYDRLRNIGLTYKIVPDRYLVVNAHVKDEEALMIHYLYDFYATNLTNLENAITEMLKKDLD